MIKVYLASDHAGLELKTKVYKSLLNNPKYQVHDLGPQDETSVDYPDFADLVCKKLHGLSLVNSNERPTHLTEAGILICGSGQGMAIRANKHSHIRAALCWSNEVTKLSREHNDANVLCLGSRVMDHQTCLENVQIFLSTAFSGGRHLQRVVKISQPI